MKLIQQLIYRLPEYSTIVNSVPKTRTYNWLGYALNRIMCIYENKILQSVIKVIHREQLDISALMFDGLMVYGNHYENTNLLQRIEDEVENDFPGLGMKFAYKNHDNVINIPENFEVPVNVENVEGVWNDLDATKNVFQLYPHWVYCKEELVSSGLYN